ncbi:cytochrome c3 family protein [Raoultibacter massiliensis]|uniref:Cytochrome c3 family protein n=1 Tax=Raoultibacter massiliensis TaxID=1852371 RepID=A0ABV1JA26_9ACTN
MDKKKRVSLTIKLGLAAALVVALIALCACGGSSGESGEGASPDAAANADAQPSSMMAVHTPDQLKLINGDWSKKNCLGCHSRDTITALTEDYGGAEGYNPHAAHTEAYDCGVCHSIEGTSVLVCNTACHGGYHGEGSGWPVPDNWQEPTAEVPSADGSPIDTSKA